MEPRPDQKKPDNRGNGCIPSDPIEEDGGIDEPYNTGAYHDKQGCHRKQMERPAPGCSHEGPPLDWMRAPSVGAEGANRYLWECRNVECIQMRIRSR